MSCSPHTEVRGSADSTMIPLTTALFRVTRGLAAGLLASWIACLPSPALANPNFEVLKIFGDGSGGPNGGSNPMSGLTSDASGQIWGTTSQGGLSNFGTIFKLDPVTKVTTTVVSFTGTTGNALGTSPYGTLLDDGQGFLWGTTLSGGASNKGTVFKVDLSTGEFTTLVEFTGTGAYPGSRPRSGLVSDGQGALWGVTSDGGDDNGGTIYKMDRQTGQFTSVAEFESANPDVGGVAYGALTPDGAGYLWGTTNGGGANNGGSVYKVSIVDGTVSAVVGLPNFSNSYAALTDDGAGYFWGTTHNAGQSNNGMVYKVHKATGAFTQVQSFPLGNRGINLWAPLVNDGQGHLWGTTWGYYGIIFKIDLATERVSNHFSFGYDTPADVEVSRPTLGALLRHTDGKLYGMTFESEILLDGSTTGGGSIYRLTPDPETLPPVVASPAANGTYGNTIPFRLTLPEDYSYDTIVTFDNGAGVIRTINGWPYAQGVHTVNVLASNPALGPHSTVTGGTTIPDGVYTVTITAGDYANNAPVSVVIPGVRIDTAAPTLDALPNLVEEAISEEGAVVTFSGSASEGATVTFSPVSGSTFPLGITTVTATATDAAGNSVSGSFTVTVRDTTAPVITASDFTEEATGPATTPVNYPAASASDAVGVDSLTYSKASGSGFVLGNTTVTVTAMDAAGNTATKDFVVRVQDTTAPSIAVSDYTVEVSDPIATPAPYPSATAADAVGVASLSYSKASGSSFVFGNTTVTATATDAAGNSATKDFVVKVQDTTAPEVSLAPQVLSAGESGTVLLPDLRSALTVSDVMSPLTRTQSPAPNTELSIGEHTLTFTVTDPSGNITTRQVSLTVGAAAPEELEITLAALTGTPAPQTAGLDPSATLSAFFAPAIGDQRELAAKVTLKVGTKLLSAIYQQDATGTAELGAFQNQPVPDLEGATFKSFGDPLLAGDGSIAFAATLQGKDVVTTGTDDSIWTDALGGGLRMILREGGEVVDGFKLKAVSSFSLRTGELLALATLQPAKGTVTTADDTVVLRVTDTGAEILLREGTALVAGDRPQASKIKTISILAPSLGSNGHGRWQADGAAVAKATLADGRTVILRLVSGEEPAPILVTQLSAEELELTTRWTKFGLPALGHLGDGYVVQGTLQSLRGEVTTSDDTALLYCWDGSHFGELVRENDPAFEVGGPVFASFLDPVINGEGEALFQGTLRGAGVTAKNKIGLWRGFPGELELAVQLGDTATDAEGEEVAGRTWTAFVNHALPDGRGPLFLAKIAGAGIGATNNQGLWSQGADGKIREIIRLGDEVPVSSESNAPTRKIKTFTLLTAPAGVFGATRSFNATGSTAVLATFTDKSQAILRLDLP